jgi:5-(carboxyamino)imidazole ribonucleotide mutase
MERSLKQKSAKKSGKVAAVTAVSGAKNDATEASAPQAEQPEQQILPEELPKRQVLVGVVMGSKSDYDVLARAAEILQEFGIPYEARVVSAHRTPDWLFQYAEQAESRGLRVIIAGAGGAAHLPGMLAAKTLVPVLGVPVPATMLNGLDSLLSIVQMPKGIPVGTLAIGKPGAANAALFAAQILATTDESLREKLRAWREARRDEVLELELEPAEIES